MPSLLCALRPGLAAACLLLGGCTREGAEASEDAVAQAAGCLPGGDGVLAAQVRGAVVADLQWKDADMQCDGGPQPDGAGIRVTVSGPLPGTSSRLRFIFGIHLEDAASGVAQAFPTNLTVLVEGSPPQLYATRGNDKCAVETLERTPLAGSGLDRVKVRGYCIGPASDIPGNTRLLLPTFSFTALLRTGEDP